MNKRVAYFISPHGFGHASRALSVMEALSSLDPSFEFDVFTTVDVDFLKTNFSGTLTIHPVQTDIGLFQINPLEADIPRTLKELESQIPYDKEVIGSAVKVVKEAGCSIIICDIAPMGIEVATQAGIPSVLIENFMWHWIYEPFKDEHPAINTYREFFSDIFSKADLHIQNEPVCLPSPKAITVPPVSRGPRTSRKEIRTQLGISEEKTTVFISIGGGEVDVDSYLSQIRTWPDIHFILQTNSLKTVDAENVTIVPIPTPIFFPDMIGAIDVLIGKIGISTYSEVFFAGIPFLHVNSPFFRESGILGTHNQEHGAGEELSIEEYRTGSWLPRLGTYLSIAKIERTQENGASQIAHILINKFF